MKKELFWLCCITISFLFTVSCKNSKSCFDEELYELHKNTFCTMDCPGVTGCDGKTYCNECVANSKGIRVVSK